MDHTMRLLHDQTDIMQLNNSVGHIILKCHEANDIFFMNQLLFYTPKLGLYFVAV